MAQGLELSSGSPYCSIPYRLSFKTSLHPSLDIGMCRTQVQSSSISFIARRAQLLYEVLDRHVTNQCLARASRISSSTYTVSFMLYTNVGAPVRSLKVSAALPSSMAAQEPCALAQAFSKYGTQYFFLCALAKIKQSIQSRARYLLTETSYQIPLI